MQPQMSLSVCVLIRELYNDNIICQHNNYVHNIMFISPDKARKGVIYPLETGVYALVSGRTFTR